MCEHFLDDNAIAYEEGQTASYEVLDGSAEAALVIAREDHVVLLVGQHVCVGVERKAAAHHVVQQDAARPHGGRSRIEAMMKQELGRFVQVCAAECAHRLVGRSRVRNKRTGRRERLATAHTRMRLVLVMMMRLLMMMLIVMQLLVMIMVMLSVMMMMMAMVVWRRG